MRLHTLHLQIRQHAFAMYWESISIRTDTRPNPPLHHGWDGRKGMAILFFKMRWDSRSSPYEWAGHLPLEERRIAIPPFFQGGWQLSSSMHRGWSYIYRYSYTQYIWKLYKIHLLNIQRLWTENWNTSQSSATYWMGWPPSPQSGTDALFPTHIDRRSSL